MTQVERRNWAEKRATNAACILNHMLSFFLSDANQVRSYHLILAPHNRLARVSRISRAVPEFVRCVIGRREAQLAMRIRKRFFLATVSGILTELESARESRNHPRTWHQPRGAGSHAFAVRGRTARITVLAWRQVQAGFLKIGTATIGTTAIFARHACAVFLWLVGQISASPLIPYHALAGVGRGDVGELALEGHRRRPAVEPFLFH